MKLSEAIRLGAMLHPQGRMGTELSHTRTCAMMAAAQAVGVSPRYPHYCLPWPWTFSQKVTCPVCGGEGTGSQIIALCLNDRHHWTREAIADWVESIEPQPAPVVPAREEMEVTA